MDFMHNIFYHGKRYQTPNVLEEGVREVNQEIFSGIRAGKIFSWHPKSE